MGFNSGFKGLNKPNEMRKRRKIN